MTHDSFSPSSGVRLWTHDGFQADDFWHNAETPEALGETNGGVILPLEAFLALNREQRNTFRGRLAVSIAPGEALDELVPYLPELNLIALQFPAFNDGRSFSKAELLRSRHGYSGALRASGDVLIDLIPHMLRLGFTELEVTNETAIRRLEQKRLGGITEQYQPTATSEPRAAGFGWRRVAAAG